MGLCVCLFLYSKSGMAGAFHSLRVPLCGTEGLCVIIPGLTPLGIVLFLCIATSVTAVVHRRRRCIVLWCSQPVRLHASPAALLLGLVLAVGALLHWRRAEDRAVRDALSPFDPALSELARVATPPMKLPKRLRVALCIFGVVPRGIRTTWPMIQAHVIRPLRAVEAELHVTVFSIDTGNETVDGNATVDPAALKLFPAGTYMQVVRQSVVDAEIAVHCRQVARQNGCHFGAHPRGTRMFVNAMRQLYIERRVGQWVDRRADEYDVVVALTADYYTALDISLQDVRYAAQSESAVFTSAMSDLEPTAVANGFANGFYIGTPLPVAKVMRRLDDAKLWQPRPPHAYESHLKRAFELHRIERRPTPMIFFKVRADGSVVWQPYLGLRQHVDLLRRTLASEALVQQVLAAWRTATAGRPKGEDLYSPRKDLGADLHSDFPS